ncbi:MAG: class I SAM-dependent methyltransferase [Burkholderiales bacterium]
MTDEWRCSSCGWTVARIDGFPAFSPALAAGNEGFRSGYFSELAKLEEKNFWFRGRNRLILWALNRYFPEASGFMEVGCGTGYVLSGIRKEFPEMKLWGSEIDASGLGFAARRVGNTELIQMDARAMPFREEFDVIGAFDVLEHVEEDEAVLGQVHAALKPGGGVMLTVPQHPFMWSQQDVAACHVRRYSRSELLGKLKRAGFRIQLATSFVSLLFPLMMLSRLVTKQTPTDPMSELRLGRGTNALFESVMNIEARLIKMNIHPPFGGSLLTVARKP